MLLLVVSDHKYGKRVPVLIGTQVIDHLVVTITREELQQAGETWKQVHLSTVISKQNTVKGLDISEYDLEGVRGKICSIREVIILPFGPTVVKDITNLMTHSKCLNIVVEPVMGHSEHISMARSYGVLKPGRGRIDVCLRNHSAKQTAMGEIAAANVILALLVPKTKGCETGQGKATTEKRKYENQKGLLDKIDLTGLGEWSQDKKTHIYYEQHGFG